MTIFREYFGDSWYKPTWGEPQPANFNVPLPDPLSSIPPEETKEMFITASKEVDPSLDPELYVKE